MSYKIEDIEGIGPANAEALAKADVTTTDHLLKAAGAKKGRKDLAEKTGLSEKRILSWANMADLMRINGVSTQFSELLHGAGVDTVKELATRNAANLSKKMEEVNAEKKLCKTSPSEKVAAGWIEQAGKLEPMITH